MGAWGSGLLQNDDSQDGLAEVIDTVEADVLRLARRRPAEAVAARVGAGIGLLLRLSSWYSFDPENETSSRLLDVLRRQEPAFGCLPKPANDLLRHVLTGNGIELAERPGKLAPRLQRVLFATDVKDFPMERTFGAYDPSLFEHPEAVRYAQEVSDRLVRWVDAAFRRKDLIWYLYDDGGGRAVAALAVLLVLEPCDVDRAKWKAWLERVRAVKAADEAEGGGGYEDEYVESLEELLRVGAGA
jgi:hypothetical protein